MDRDGAPCQLTGELVGTPGGLIFLKQAIEGTTPRVQCGTAQDFLTLDQPRVDALLGSDTANGLRALNTTRTGNPFAHPH